MANPEFFVLYRMRIIGWCFLLIIASACLVHGDEYNRKLKGRKAIRGRGGVANRQLQDEMPLRKVQDLVSKDFLKFAQGNWEDIVFTPPPNDTPAPSDDGGAFILTDAPTFVSSDIPSGVPSSIASDLPSDVPSMSPSVEAEQDPLTMGVYYYPWHADDFHRGDGYIRQDLQPPQEPELGEYDDRDPEVVLQHLEWSRQANIGLWVTSWWGPLARTDNTTRTAILPHPQLGNHQIALFYETDGRMLNVGGSNPYVNVQSDIEYMCEHYFGHPNYFRIEGKPVLFIYLSRVLSRNNFLQTTLSIMRQTALNACGEEIYVVGDQIFGKATDKDFTDPEYFAPFLYLDAVTNYDIYGSVADVVDRKGGQVSEAEVNFYYGVEQQLWSDVANAYGCKYVPSISPGYNDVSVRDGNPPLSRSLQGQAPGSLLRTALRGAIPLADPDTKRLIMINSFNEWHEDTQLEPVRAAGAVPTNLPFAVTNGITYRGYGTQYLEIVREGTENM